MSTFPKIELHVHLEGTVRPDTLRAIAQRNDYALPDDLESLYRYRDFEHFIEVFVLTMRALQRYDDFREIVVAYADLPPGPYHTCGDCNCGAKKKGRDDKPSDGPEEPPPDAWADPPETPGH